MAFAAVSRSQLDRAPENLRSQTLGVVPLAVPWPEDLEVEPGPHALVLARITPDKAQDVALRVCREADVPLVLAGPVAGIGDPDELRRRLAAGDPSLTGHPDVEFFRSPWLPTSTASARGGWAASAVRPRNACCGRRGRC